MSQYKFGGRRAVSLVAAGVVLALAAIAISAPDDVQSSTNIAYEKAVEPAEALVAKWDFAGAKDALAKLKFQDKALANRLTVRRDVVMRLMKLKATILSRAGSGIKLGGGTITAGARISSSVRR